jgi:twitching motility protein PilT
MSKVARQLGQLLVDSRLLTKDVVEHELAQAESSGTPFAKLIVDQGQVRSEDVLRVVAGEMKLEFHELDPNSSDHLESSAVARLPVEVARQLQALPVHADDEDRLVIAVSDPFSSDKADMLRKAVGGEVALALAPKKPLAAAIEREYAALEASGEPAAAAGAGEDILAQAAASDTPHVNELLEILIDRGGSDLHLTAGSKPQIRLNGQLVELSDYPMMLPATLRTMIYSILTGRQREKLEEERELDASHPLPGKGRFRVNVFFQRDSVGSVMRAIPNDILPLADLGMPDIVESFAKLPRGLVLVTGPTGSGKSTTLASLIDLVNSTRTAHVMTVEDPIEFMHKHKRSVVNQREVGTDTLGFALALKHALRQDPDVILVGEMRDLETISTAITASETGHLVFATLHTQDAPQSIERMIDVFPSHQQQQVRVQLASSIQAVVSQQLVPTVDGSARVAAVEVMVATPAIRNMIREGKVHQIASAMQAGNKHGMITMDKSLAEYVKLGSVAYEVAVERASDPDEFATLAKGG